MSGQDRHHRGPPVIGIPRLHQPVRGRQLHLRRLLLTVGAVLVPSCASAATALCSAAPSPALDLVCRNESHRRRTSAPIALPPTDPRYVDGGPGGEIPSVTGMKVDEARKRLLDAGFRVADRTTPVNSNATKGSVVGTTPSGRTIPGSIITINTSTDYVPPPPPVYRPGPEMPPPPATQRVGAAPATQRHRDSRLHADNPAGPTSAAATPATAPPA